MFRFAFAGLVALFVVLATLPEAHATIPGEWQHCYNGTCYDSLHAAEDAMEAAQQCGTELEPDGDPEIDTNGTVTRKYRIRPRDAVIDEDYFKLAANWPGYCGHLIPNIPDSWCGTAGAAIAKTLELMTANPPPALNHCEVQIFPGQQLYGYAYAVNQSIVPITQPVAFNTQQTQLQPPDCQVFVGNWYCNQGEDHWSGCTFGKATDSHCDACRRPGNEMQDFPTNACTSTLTAQIITQRLLQKETCDGNDSNVGNPCVPSTGAKLLQELDFDFGGFSIVRNYNSLSQSDDRSGLGHKGTSE